MIFEFYHWYLNTKYSAWVSTWNSDEVYCGTKLDVPIRVAVGLLDLATSTHLEVHIDASESPLDTGFAGTMARTEGAATTTVHLLKI